MDTGQTVYQLSLIWKIIVTFKCGLTTLFTLSGWTRLLNFLTLLAECLSVCLDQQINSRCVQLECFVQNHVGN